MVVDGFLGEEIFLTLLTSPDPKNKSVPFHYNSFLHLLTFNSYNVYLKLIFQLIYSSAMEAQRIRQTFRKGSSCNICFVFSQFYYKLVNIARFNKEKSQRVSRQGHSQVRMCIPPETIHNAIAYNSFFKKISKNKIIK